MELMDNLQASINTVVGDEGKSKEIARQITRDFGGAQLYIPYEKNAFREEMEEEIVNEFDGANSREVARKYGITVSTFYKILKKVRKKRIQREEASQGTLFE